MVIFPDYLMRHVYILNDKDNQAEINKRTLMLLNKPCGYLVDELGRMT